MQFPVPNKPNATDNGQASAVRWSNAMAFCCCLMALAPAHAAAEQSVWRDETGKAVADSPERKSTGGFGAWLLATNDEAKALEKWRKPGAKVHIDDAGKAQRNQPVMCTVVFFGCTADRNGNCNVEVKYQIAQPNGKSYFDGPWQDAWVGKRPPPTGSLELSTSYLRLVIEAGEPLGTYVLRAQLVDRNSQRKLALSRQIVVVEAGAARKK